MEENATSGLNNQLAAFVIISCELRHEVEEVLARTAEYVASHHLTIAQVQQARQAIRGDLPIRVNPEASAEHAAKSRAMQLQARLVAAEVLEVTANEMIRHNRLD